MTEADWIRDRLDLLAEVAAIERDACALEQHGPVPDITDMRSRLAAVRVGVVEQLRAALEAMRPSEIRH